MYKVCSLFVLFACVVIVKTELRCKGVDNGCCTEYQPCEKGDGDCDNDGQCAGDLTCGDSNCPWGDGDDCCEGKKSSGPQCKPHNPNEDCWYKCGEKGGKCSFCGTNGYCCLKGWKGCPDWATSAAHNRHHSCVSCTETDKCKVNNGGCSHKCLFVLGAVKCSCPSGYTLGSDKKTCTDINECSTGANKCGPNAICTNKVGTYTCSCKKGFQMASGSCKDVNECATGNGGCSHTCVNTPGGFTCRCPFGFTLNGNKCVDINECARGGGVCSHICVNHVGGYHCACPNGFRIRSDGKNCERMPECKHEYTCVTGKEQKGHDILFRAFIFNRDVCADLCCKTSGCVSFDYDQFWKHCWLSKTTWQSVPLTAGLFNLPIPNRWACQKKGVQAPRCPRFRCISGKRQNGFDIAYSKEATEGECRRKCCRHQDCIGYDYLSIGHDCWLSKTPWSKVRPSGGLFNAPILFMKTCQSADV